MKTLRIGTEAQADRMLVESLFKPINGHTLNVGKWDMAKYRVNPATPYVGREVQVSDHVVALFMVDRKDSDGAYKSLRCLSVTSSEVTA